MEVVSDFPVLTPRSETELAEIIAKVRLHGNCTIRPAGAGHTEAAFVTQPARDKNVVVVNLANFVPPSSWDQRLDKTTGRLRISGGASILQVVSLTRPHGFLFETQTAGTFFSIGGIVANPSVHGSTFDKGRINEAVTAVRVMLANGTVREIHDSEEVKAWRGSLGLLGIITAVEIQLRRDMGVLLDYKETYYDDEKKPWNRENVIADVAETYTRFHSAEWFYNVYADMIQHVRVRYDAGVPFDPSATAASYAKELALYPNNDLVRTGGQMLLSSRLFFKLYWLVDSVTDGYFQRMLSELLMGGATSYVSEHWKENNRTRRDLFFVPASSLGTFKQLYCSIQCEADCVTDGTMFAIVNATRTWLRKQLVSPNAGFYQSMAFEWRIITARPGTQLLEHLEPGKWLGIEIITAHSVGHVPQSSSFLYDLEQIWLRNAPLKVRMHHGKASAFGYVANTGQVEPYANRAALDSMYTEDVKAAFKAKMNEYDPAGIFRGGDMMKQL